METTIFNSPVCNDLIVLPNEELEVLKYIEKCGRICYKSQDRATEESFAPFYKMLIGLGHTSVLSHSNLCFLVNQDKYFDFNLKTKILFSRSLSWVSTNIGRRDYFFIKKIKNTRHTLCSASLRAWIELLGTVTSSNAILHQVFKKAYPLIHRLSFGDSFSDAVPDVSILGIEVSLVPTKDQLDYLSSYGWDVPSFSTTVKVDRGLSHEIVRHSTLAFSQESTRYVSYNRKPISIMNWSNGMDSKISQKVSESVNNQLDLYSELIAYGVKPELARNVLPHSIMSDMAISGKWGVIQELNPVFSMDTGWSNFLRKRCSPRAHPHIQELANFYQEKFKSEFSLSI